MIPVIGALDLSFLSCLELAIIQRSFLGNEERKRTSHMGSKGLQRSILA